jgi:hypothetical protein
MTRQASSRATPMISEIPIAAPPLYWHIARQDADPAAFSRVSARALAAAPSSVESSA